MNTQKIEQIKQALQLLPEGDPRRVQLEAAILTELEKRSAADLLLSKLREQTGSPMMMPGAAANYIVAGEERTAMISELVAGLVG